MHLPLLEAPGLEHLMWQLILSKRHAVALTFPVKGQERKLLPLLHWQAAHLSCDRALTLPPQVMIDLTYNQSISMTVTLRIPERTIMIRGRGRQLNWMKVMMLSWVSHPSLISNLIIYQTFSTTAKGVGHTDLCLLQTSPNSQIYWEPQSTHFWMCCSLMLCPNPIHLSLPW